MLISFERWGLAFCRPMGVHPSGAQFLGFTREIENEGKKTTRRKKDDRNTARFFERTVNEKPHPEMCYRPALAIIRCRAFDQGERTC